MTPVARDVVEPDDSPHAARCASHASLACSANASLLAPPAEDNQSAPLHVPLLPCTALATPGTLNASMPAVDTRALPVLPAFSASAAHPFASLPADSSSCPLSLRGDPEGARALFGSGPDDPAVPPIRTRRPSDPRARPPMVRCRAELGLCPLSRFQAPYSHRLVPVQRL